jgi:hypothetical protein
MKQFAKLAAATFIVALVIIGSGCRSSPPSAPPPAAVATAPGGLDPVQSWNQYLRVLAEGDPAAIRAHVYAHPDSSEPVLTGSIAIYHSVAGLRRACDQAYGTGQLTAAGFHCFTSQSQLPKGSTFKIAGTNATVFAPGWDPIHLVRVDNMWKEDYPSLSEIVRSHAATGATQPLPPDRLALNLQAVSQILDRTADGVRTNTYLSAADAFGVLNQRLRGQARAQTPLAIAWTTDLSKPAPATPASNSVSIIELRGDPAALGKSQAEQIGGTIRSVMNGYFDHAFDMSSKQGKKDYKRAVKFAAGFERYLRPEHREELRALAAGVGVDPGGAMLAQCFPETYAVGACSTIALPASASPDGIARFGRNMDYYTFGILDQRTYLLVYHPRDRYAFVSVAAAPGLIGVISGMNEYGLCLATMEVPRSLRMPHAMPSMLLYRTVLENCRTVEEAVAFLQKTPRQTAFNLMLMDATGDRAVAEIAPDKVTVRRAPGDAALLSTNHQRQEDLDSPGRCSRYDFLHDAARRQFGRISESGVEDLLTGAAQGDLTYQSMIFDPVNRMLTLAAGADAPNHGFTRIDLKPYFN